MGRGATGALGNQAELTALRFLRSAGLTLVARNYRCRGGEIDLVMMHAGCLTFIEVRSRRCSRFSDPAVTVDYRKQKKLLRTAALFLANTRAFTHCDVRFDVVAISADKKNSIEWIQDAFRPDDAAL